MRILCIHIKHKLRGVTCYSAEVFVEIKFPRDDYNDLVIDNCSETDAICVGSIEHDALSYTDGWMRLDYIYAKHAHRRAEPVHAIWWYEKAVEWRMDASQTRFPDASASASSRPKRTWLNDERSLLRPMISRVWCLDTF